jgi:hypothetical protein
MMILDVIQDADSEYVIFFLLAAYLEAVLFAGKLPEYIKSLPIAGVGDVAMRYQRLMPELHKAAEQSDDKSCLEMQDALRVFDAALCRLAFLERARESSRPFTVSGSPGRYESQVAGSSPSPPSRSPA